MSNKSKIFLKGVADVSPLMIPVVPFGIIFGVLAIDLGLSPITTMAMSIIIFGGASQIIFFLRAFILVLLKTNYMININWSLNAKFFINFMLVYMMRMYKNWYQQITVRF